MSLVHQQVLDANLRYAREFGAKAALAGSLHTAELVEGNWRNVQQEGGSLEGRYVRWLAFKDLEASVREDVARIQSHPLVPADVPIHGYIYDVRSGQLQSVPASGDSAERRTVGTETLYDDGSG